jgi:starvation-inducible DNA-binding protein
MIPKIGLSEEGLDKCINLLAIVLSDEMTLYIKTRKFHWNVAGQSFMELHKLFENQYTELEQLIDAIAERISKLGGKTIGTMHEFSLLTRIVEHPNKYPVQKLMVTELVSDHQTLIYELRKDIDICANECHDAGTADLLTGILQQHETIAWVLGRYLS